MQPWPKFEVSMLSCILSTLSNLASRQRKRLRTQLRQVLEWYLHPAVCCVLQVDRCVHPGAVYMCTVSGGDHHALRFAPR